MRKLPFTLTYWETTPEERLAAAVREDMDSIDAALWRAEQRKETEAC